MPSAYNDSQWSTSQTFAASSHKMNDTKVSAEVVPNIQNVDTPLGGRAIFQVRTPLEIAYRAAERNDDPTYADGCAREGGLAPVNRAGMHG